jgi:hypothetical protein
VWVQGLPDRVGTRSGLALEGFIYIYKFILHVSTFNFVSIFLRDTCSIPSLLPFLFTKIFFLIETASNFE